MAILSIIESPICNSHLSYVTGISEYLKSNINSVLVRIKNYVEDEEAILLLMLKLLDIENIQEKKIEKVDEEELIINMLTQLL